MLGNLYFKQHAFGHTGATTSPSLPGSNNYLPSDGILVGEPLWYLASLLMRTSQGMEQRPGRRHKVLSSTASWRNREFPRILKTMVWYDTKRLTATRPLGIRRRNSQHWTGIAIEQLNKAWGTQIYYGHDWASRKVIGAIITMDILYWALCLWARTTCYILPAAIHLICPNWTKEQELEFQHFTVLRA